MTKRLSILPARMILRDCHGRLTLMAEYFSIGTGRRRGRGCNFSQPAMDPFRSQTSEGLEQISGEMHLKASYFECASKPPCHPQAMTVPPSLIPHIHSFFKQRVVPPCSELISLPRSRRRPLGCPSYHVSQGLAACLSLLLPVLSVFHALTSPPSLSPAQPSLQVPQHLPSSVIAH